MDPYIILNFPTSTNEQVDILRDRVNAWAKQDYKIVSTSTDEERWQVIYMEYDPKPRPKELPECPL